MFSKKFLGAALSLAMAAASVAPVLASTGFSDVKDADTIASAVQRLNSLGIMQGVKNSDGTFSFNGDGSFTRAQAAKVFVVAKGLSKVKSGTAVFTDVTKDNWAYNWVNVAKQYGIVNGTSDTTFTPSKNVTYGELAKMAVSTLGYTEEDLDGTTYPYNYVQKAADLKLFDNVDNVDPDEAATRTDVAKVVNAMLDTATKAEQTAMDAWAAVKGLDATATNGYAKNTTFFASVAGKFGVKAVTGTTFTATSASDSSLKANQFKIGTDSTVYTLPNASEDFSGNFYKTYSGTFYVSSSDNTKVVFFDESNIKGTVKDAGKIDQLKAGDVNTLQSVDSNKNVTGSYTVVPTVQASVPGVTPVVAASAPAVIVNGKAASTTALANLIRANATTTVKLVDTDSNGTYDAVVATIVNNAVKVSAAPKFDLTGTDATKSIANVTYGNGLVSIPLTYASNGSTVGSAVYVTGAATKLTEIKADDIVYVKATDDNSAVTLDVFRTPVVGTVTGTTVDSKGVINGVVINGVTYPVSADVLATLNSGVPLGIKGTFVVDKDKNVFKFTSDADSISAAAPTVGGAVYGIVTAATDKSVDIWGAATLPQVKFFKFDGTTSQVSVTQATYNSLFAGMTSPKFVYYTTLDTTGVGTTFNYVLQNTSLNSANVASDTKIINLVSSTTNNVTTWTPSIVKASDVKAPGNTTAVWAAVKNPAVNAMGDYYGVVYVNAAPAAPATTTVGYVENYVGSALVGTTTVDVWNVYENGVAKVVKAKQGLLSAGTVYTGLTTGADGVTTDAGKATVVANAANTPTTTVTASASTDTVSIIDAASLRIKFVNAGIKNITSNAVVLKSTSNAVGSLSDVAGASATYAGDNVKFYLDSNGNVVLIVVAK